MSETTEHTPTRVPPDLEATRTSSSYRPTPALSPVDERPLSAVTGEVLDVSGNIVPDREWIMCQRPVGAHSNSLGGAATVGSKFGESLGVGSSSPSQR